MEDINPAQTDAWAQRTDGQAAQPHADDVGYNRTLETCIIVLTEATPMHS